MRRVPANVQDLLNFCNEHANTWTPIPAELGLVSGDITKLKAAYDAAFNALAAQSTARDAAKAATLTANAKVKDLRTVIAALVRQVVTFAENSTDPMAVFAAANLEPTSPRTPSQPPGQPNLITATLDDEGNVTLKWKCQNPPGGNVVYSVMRREGSDGDFHQVGVTGARMFLDDSITGTSIVQYQIKAFRGQMAGAASPLFTLQFGRGGGGMFAAESTPTMKIAA